MATGGGARVWGGGGGFPHLIQTAVQLLILLVGAIELQQLIDLRCESAN